MTVIAASTVNELTKRLWPNWEIRELGNTTHPVLETIGRKLDVQLGGSGFYWPVRTKLAGGAKYMLEDEDLPAGRQTTVQQAVAYPTILAGVIQLTGLSMAITSGNAMAFAKVYDENIQSTLNYMLVLKEGAAFRDGSGLIATFVDNPGGSSTGPYTLSDVGFIHEGMFFDIIDATATTRHVTSVGIDVVDWPNKQVVFDQAITSAVDASDRLFIAGEQGASGALVNRQPLGLAASIGVSGSYAGIDRNSVGNWRSTIITASKFLDEDIFMRGRTRLEQEIGVRVTQFASEFKVVTHPMQLDVLFTLAIPRVRYMANEGFELGHKGDFRFGGMSFETTYDCPPDVAYMGDWSQHGCAYTANGELHIDSEFGGTTAKWIGSKDQMLAYAKEYSQFICLNPSRFLKIASLTQRTR